MTDRQLPHDIAAEDAVLGGILVEPSALYDVPFLEPAHFFSGRHGGVFAAMRKLAQDDKPVDFVLLVNELGTDAEAFIVGLMQVVPTAVQTRHYGDIVYNLAKRRQLIRAAGKVADAAFSTDAPMDEVYDKAQSAVLDVVGGAGHGDVIPARDGLHRLFDITAGRYANGGVTVGLKTGYADLDRLLEGLEPGNVYVLAARPGVGKSALEGGIRLNVARAGARVLSFNLEMPEVQCWQRLVAGYTGLSFQNIRSGRMTADEWAKFGEAIGRMADLPIWIDDTPSITATQMHAKARRVQAQYGLDLVTVDYLQLMASNSTFNNRVQQVGEISRGLKQMALSLDVPVLALSQLNRGLEARADKRPMLADLRDSGDIEQDADVVMFLYRESYHYPDDAENPHIADVIVAKNRNGPTGTVSLYWDAERIRFMNLARREVVL